MNFTFPLSRREMLQRFGTGLGVLGLASVLADETSAASPTNPLAPKAPHFPAKAKRVIHLFMNGGPSQVDTFDPKPALAKYNGQKPPSRDTQDRTRHRQSDAIAVRIRETRQERSRNQRTLPERRRACRRSVRDPLDAHRMCRITNRRC